ncbi:hypothetical protein EJ08DRAFT_696530 [Tothia fuscella]|uniref:DUF7703 domain-containing protein n=1 Tax=Tothia fuscella TaxID=1048955 RepID=A0A9P4NTM6_9PEZI|nr:hypothetical protein EJ08DRAFT_696530 [Tothia fuscella]
MASKEAGRILIGDSRWLTTPDYSVFLAFGAIAIWSSVPLTIRLLVTLKRRRGLYFWSILVCGWGLSLRQLGYVLKFMVPKCPYLLGDILSQGGWVGMVTGFSMVLYSRLNLILESQVVRRRVLWMIIINAIVFHPLMITISIGMNVLRKGGRGGSAKMPAWQRVNVPAERVQILIFSGQETLISLFYVRAAYQYLKGRFADKEKTRRAMFLLLAVQVFIVAVDIFLIVIDFASFLQLKLFIHSLVELSQLGVPGFSSFSNALASVGATKNKAPEAIRAKNVNWIDDSASSSPNPLPDITPISSPTKPEFDFYTNALFEDSMIEGHSGGVFEPALDFHSKTWLEKDT